MTNAELIATIRAEIERQIENLGISDEAILVSGELSELLSFLSDLEKSLPAKITDGEVLEWEINRTYHEGSVADTWDIDHVTYENIAEYFYDLGCRRTAEKYDEIEYNRQRAEEPPVALVAIKPILPAALKPCIATFKEQGGSSEIPKALEEAANVYSNCYSNPDGALARAARRAYITGAKWDREQMMKEAVEGIVENWNPEPHPEITIPLNPEEYSNGDKVRVIVLKKEG